MMTVLQDYAQFDGLHWETGTVRNFFAYRGVQAPHTGQPYTEALLMGVSGGAVMGYFSFAYEGYDPMARILTRNTFDPWDKMLSRLGVVQNVAHTSKPAKGRENLLKALADGTPAIVWADMFSLPYNNLPADEKMWIMMPILVYGYDEAADRVWIADRARAAATVTTAVLAAARARVKKDKFRVITLAAPNEAKLAAAVQAGIWDCINLYTEKPPKGSKNNFGLAAYQRWARLLTRPKTRLSWEKEFPAGRKMYAGLNTAYEDIVFFGKDGNAERDVYAAFLQEAAVILQRPALNEIAAVFQHSAAAWQTLAEMLLPDSVPLLGETRTLRNRAHRLFLADPMASLAERQQIQARLAEIKAEVSDNFPMTDADVTAFREELSEQLLHIHDIEAEAVQGLKAAMA